MRIQSFTVYKLFVRVHTMMRGALNPEFNIHFMFCSVMFVRFRIELNLFVRFVFIFSVTSSYFCRRGEKQPVNGFGITFSRTKTVAHTQSFHYYIILAEAEAEALNVHNALPTHTSRQEN